MMNFVGPFGLQRFSVANAASAPAAQPAQSPSIFGGGSPQGPTVGFLELPDPLHNGVVRQTIAQSGADPGTIGFIQANNNVRPSNNPAQYLANSVSDALNNISSQIEGLTNNPNNRIRVLNVSYSANTLANTQGFLNEYNRNPEFQAKTRQAAGIPANATPQQQTQAIYNYIESTLANNPQASQAQARYQQVTKAAAEKGISIVVAAGNNQDTVQGSQDQGFRLSDDLAYNYFAKSDHVISVAAIDDKDTPGITADDQIARFSAKGNNRFHATLAADGVNIQGQDGTSFAAPQVSGTIAAMLQQNPNLTYQQINQILRTTARDNPNISATQEGAGLLQSDAAIAAAANPPAPGEIPAGGAAAPADAPAPAAPAKPLSWTEANKQRSTEVIGQEIAAADKPYKITFGDTLGKIALAIQKQPGYTGNGNLQDDIRKLAAANKISNPNIIRVGASLDPAVLLKKA